MKQISSEKEIKKCWNCSAKIHTETTVCPDCGKKTGKRNHDTGFAEKPADYINFILLLAAGSAFIALLAYLF